VLTKLSFGAYDLTATLEISMTSADLSGKQLGASGAVLLAAFLRKFPIPDQGPSWISSGVPVHVILPASLVLLLIR
jgi:hypothetical protein